MVNIVAYQVSESIDIKAFKNEFDGQFISGSSFELFYLYKNGYLFILNYGVVVFANIGELERTNLLRLIRDFSQEFLEKRYREDFTILQSEDSIPVFSYNALSVPKVTDTIVKVAMLQVGQSAALDFYHEKAQKLLEETLLLTDRLEKIGKLNIGKRNLLKFIGRALNTKTRIIDDLYVIDSPANVWEDELLGKIHDGLSKTFDIAIRFREIEYTLKSVETNTSIFIELIHARESHKLEWIIIVLILIEVIHMLYNVVTGTFIN